MPSEKNKVPLQATKWLKIQMLLDAEEMGGLLTALGAFSLYANGTICPQGQISVAQDLFLTHYSQYVEQLKNGQEIDPGAYRSAFALVMTRDESAIFTVPISQSQCLVRCWMPVVLMQPHQINYSPIDHKFRAMMYGTESISWGIQFAYPQIYQDPLTNEIEKVSLESSNTQLFQALQRWTRAHTVPTPFYVEGTRYNVPMRLGKLCFPWINRHVQLIKQGISVQR